MKYGMSCVSRLLGNSWLTVDQQLFWGAVRLYYPSKNAQILTVNIVYVIESAAYGVIFTSCLCQSPNERGASE